MKDIIKDYYSNEYYTDKKIHDDGWARTRLYYSWEYIEKFPKKSILLNLGCGPGYESEELKKKGYYVVGADISSKALKLAKNYQDESVFMDMNHEPYPFKSSTFDIIYSSEVVKHLPFIDVYLEQCYRILKKRGVLLITTDNPVYWRNRINMLLGKFDWSAQQEHFHYYTPQKLSDFAKKHKLKTIGAKALSTHALGRFLPVSLAGCYLLVLKT